MTERPDPYDAWLRDHFLADRPDPVEPEPDGRTDEQRERGAEDARRRSSRYMMVLVGLFLLFAYLFVLAFDR